MMVDSAPYGLETRELDTLHEFLLARADAGGMMLDAVHGLLTAVVIGPDPIPASEWLGHVVPAEAGFSNEAEANQILALLIKLHNSIVQELETLSYQPIFGEIEAADGDDEDDYLAAHPEAATAPLTDSSTALSARGWCEGFSLGVDLRSTLWENRMRTDPALLDLLSPLITVAAEEGMFDPETAESEAADHLSEDEFELALNSVAGAVADVQQYWRNQPPGADESVSSEPGPRPLLRKRGGHWLH
jgi:uncharacterized protein